MTFSIEDYKIEEAKSLIAAGVGCITGGMTGLAAALSTMILSGRLDPVAVQNYINSGAVIPEYLPMMILFFGVVVFGMTLRSLGLRKLKKLAEAPKLKK
jgi:hypothetical protein